MKAPNIEDVVGPIHPSDTMFSGSYEHYHSVGESAVACLREALDAVERTFDDVGSLLDMPCGYGRVTRRLVRHLPPERISACDIQQAGVNFVRETFGVHGIYTTEDFGSTLFPEPFDLIWVGSLVTHLRVEKGFTLLNWLLDQLTPKGSLVFTTAGAAVFDSFLTNEARRGMYFAGKAHNDFEKVKNSYLEQGHSFIPYANNPDYGLTFLHLSTVLSLIGAFSPDRCRLVYYKRAGWDHHQDVFSLQKL